MHTCVVSPVDARPHCRVLARAILLGSAFVFCSTAVAQGLPGGSERGGHHGGRGPAQSEGAHRSPQQESERPPESLEALLRTAHELRQSLMLNEAQTERWAEMQADLRDAVDARRTLAARPAVTTQAPNPALVFVQDMAVAESALNAALDKLSKSMQAVFDALDERQRKMFADRMTAALSGSATP